MLLQSGVDLPEPINDVYVYTLENYYLYLTALPSLTVQPNEHECVRRVG